MGYQCGCGQTYCASSSGGYVTRSMYSALESKVSNSAIAKSSRLESTVAAEAPQTSYVASNYGGYQQHPTTANYAFVPDDFLNPARGQTPFVGDARQIMEHVTRAFTLTTGQQFPEDIVVRVCNNEDFESAHAIFGGERHEGTIGFAVNRKAKGQLNEIFIRKEELARIMVTVGHELGHIMSAPLRSPLDEEAKAFAFSLAWMRVIKEHNIANLSPTIMLDKPAQNGLHDQACDFVLDLVNKGQDPMRVFSDLVAGRTNVKRWL